MSAGVFTLLLIHLALTAAMTGLIWFVQIVHYPLYREVPEDAFAAYQQRHLRGAGPLIAPIMVFELLTLALVLWKTPHPMFFASGVVLAGLWLSTFLIQVPLHRRLEARRDETSIRRLVGTNWIRTLGWNLRTVLVNAGLWGILAA